MRVWLVDPAANTPHYDLALLHALREAGVDASWMTSPFLYDPSTNLEDGNVHHLFFRGLKPLSGLLTRQHALRRAARLALYPVGLARLKRAFDREPPDLLHVQWTLLPGIDAGFFKRLAHRVPLVLTMHDTAPRRSALTRMADMYPFLMLADRIIVHAEENRRAVLSRVNIDPERIHVVMLGPSFEAQPVPPRAEARARLDIPPQAKVILFFGVIKPYKGLLDLIDAFARLREKLPDAHLLVAGRPESSTQPYEEAVRDHRLAPSVTFHARYIPDSQVPDYFAAADIICLPYREASQSAVLLAAYRYGLPVVATSVGALTESVEHGQNGLLVPPTDPGALAAALQALLADPARCAAFGARSAQLAEERYSWAAAARATLDVYQASLADRVGLTGTGGL